MTATSVAEFCTKWGLNEQAMMAINQMEPELQKAVMLEFFPREHTRNASDLFIAFARSRTRSAYGGTGGMVSRADVDTFVQKWSLNAESYACLLSLPMDILDGVIRSFFPREHARDINNLFQAFAQSRLNNVMAAYQNAHATAAYGGYPGVGGGVTTVPTTTICPTTGQPIVTMTPVPQEMAAAMGLAYPGMMPGAGAHGAHAQQHAGLPTGPMEKSEFIARHRLNDRSKMLIDALEVHHPSSLQKVMMQFNPFDVTRDVNDTFLSFWKPRAINALTEKYSLSRDNVALFKGLDLNQTVETLKEFNASGLDANAAFTQYIHAKLSGGGAPVGQGSVYPTIGAPVGMGVGGTGGGVPIVPGVMNYADYLDPSVLASFHTGSFIDPSTLADPMAAGSRKRPLDTVSGFVSQHNLSATSEELMRSLTPTQQAEVISRFAPKHNTRDMDALFKKFVLSVQLKG